MKFSIRENINLKRFLKPFITLREEIAASSCEEYKDCLILDDTFVRTITLFHLPDNTYPALLDKLVYGLDFPFHLSVSFRLLDTQKALDKLRTKGRRKKLFLGLGHNQKFKNTPTEVAAQEIDELDELVTRSGEKLVSFVLILTVAAESEEVLEERTKVILTLFKNLQNASARTEEYSQLKYFTASLPGNAYQAVEREHICTSQNAADLLPLSKPAEGTKEAWALLHTDRQTLFRFSPFSSELSSYNQIVIGQTGMGKSFLMNTLLYLYLLKNPDLKIFIVDVGGSYRKFVQAVEGQYVDFDLSNPKVSISPFVDGQNIWNAEAGDFDQHAIGTIASITEQMVMDPSQEALNLLEYAVLEQVIRRAYKETSGTPDFFILQKILLEYSKHSQDPEDIQIAKNLGKRLSPWTQGVYSKLFHGAPPLKIDRPVFCFDLLSSLEDKKRLQGVIMSTITHLMFQKMVQDFDPKIFVGDEVWAPMSSRSGELFFEGNARMSRKHHLSMMLATQGSIDFQKSKSSATVLNQSKIKWILKIKDNPEELQKILQLTERELDFAQNLSMSKGEYSQALLKADDFSSVITLYSSPLLYWLATTNPRDRQLEEEHRKRFSHRSLLEILKLLSIEHPKGFSEES